jgi:hypothetical protein
MPSGRGERVLEQHQDLARPRFRLRVTVGIELSDELQLISDPRFALSNVPLGYCQRTFGFGRFLAFPPGVSHPIASRSNPASSALVVLGEINRRGRFTVTPSVTPELSLPALTRPI